MSNQPRTREMQDSINHLIIGVGFLISVTITTFTTILTMGQAWVMLAYFLPFAYIFFPQLQRKMNDIREAAVEKALNGNGDGKHKQETAEEVIVSEEKCVSADRQTIQKIEEALDALDAEFEKEGEQEAV